MWDNQYVGRDITNFSNNGQYHAVSKVTLAIDDETAVSAGDDTGSELRAECSFATREMAEAILNQVKGFQYLAYSAEAVNIDPAAELGDGITVSGLYSVIARIDDSGNGYPAVSAPGESELEDEYPVVGPGTQEFTRRIESVKKWAEESDRALRNDISSAMEESGKLITGQLGGHYIVTMNPEDGKPNGWAEMDTDNIETAKNIWRMTLGGLGHYPNGINSTPDIAITMDGKINASMILTGELWANLIKSGRIESRRGNVYFDLDANDGKGEIASSILRGVEDGSTTTAIIGMGTYSGGEEYEGLNINTSSGPGGSLLLVLERQKGTFTLANKAEISSNGDFTIRSQAISSNPGGNNQIDLYGNSTTGEGTVEIWRGKRSGSEAILVADETATTIRFDDKIVLGAWDNILNLNCNGKSVLLADSNATSLEFNGKDMLTANNGETNLYSTNGKIQFVTNGYARASIERDGSARFGDLYTNGVKVTSDRSKKENISPMTDSALEMVRKAAAYRYTLKGTEERHTGLMFDEAPACIRSEGTEKSVDLYGMITVLWKAVQELEKKIDSMKEENHGG